MQALKANIEQLERMLETTPNPEQAPTQQIRDSLSLRIITLNTQLDKLRLEYKEVVAAGMMIELMTPRRLF